MTYLPRREPLAEPPTPLLELSHRDAALGGPSLPVKRDDLASEYFVADACTPGC